MNMEDENPIMLGIHCLAMAIMLSLSIAVIALGIAFVKWILGI